MAMNFTRIYLAESTTIQTSSGLTEKDPGGGLAATSTEIIE